jgi:PAS domain S-box-containing protein
MTEKTDAELLTYIKELEQKLFEAEETIDAIKNYRVDALVVSTHTGDHVYTLSSADRPYRIFLEQMNEGALTAALDGTIFFCNKRFSDMIKVRMENLIGADIKQWVFAEDLNRFEKLITEADSAVNEEIRFVRSDGSTIYSYLSSNKIESDDEPVVSIVATDLTEKKRNEEIIAEGKLAHSILEQAGESIVVCDENYKIIRSSKGAEKLAGEKVLYKNFDSVFPLYDNEENPVTIESILQNKNSDQIEINLCRNEEEYINLILNVGVLSGATGDIIGYVINLTNITKHIEAEEKLQASLKEKTILLKEIHHRVKNNLQIISSLLRLQSLYINDESLLGVLNESQNRIKAMALIHQKLYESKSFASINFKDYIKELLQFLSSTYMVHLDKVSLKAPKEKITFGIDIAVPVGLIINELVTNSFKHAFKGNTDGRVEINIEINNSEDVNFLIKDNGSGFPENVDFYNPSSLGLQLVHSLIEQVGGSIEIFKGEGTEIKFCVPNEQAL